jgi:hypothetical protein
MQAPFDESTRNRRRHWILALGLSVAAGLSVVAYLHSIETYIIHDITRA